LDETIANEGQLRQRRSALGAVSKRFRFLLHASILLLVGLCCTSSVPALSGCTTHQCDSDCIVYGVDPPPPNCVSVGGALGQVTNTGGVLIWESSGPTGAWPVDFRGARTVGFQLPPGFDGTTIATLEAFITTDPDHAEYGFAPAAGQLAVFTGVWPSAIWVQNQSCAEYYLRVVATAPAPPAPGSADGGAGD
jgi:hypothetical protein